MIKSGWLIAVLVLGALVLTGSAQADTFVTAVINHAAFGGGPIESWSLNITTGTATAAGSFVPSGATDSNNGRAIAVTNTQFYYTELTGGFGPTVSVETGPYNGGAGGADNGGFPNPIPGRGIQNLHFGAAGLYIVSGYPTLAPQVFIVDPVSGTILNTPVTLATDPGADGFTILSNGNYLVNQGDAVPLYDQYDPTTGARIPGTTITSPCPGGSTGVDTDGTHLFFDCVSSAQIAETDLSGNLIHLFTLPGAVGGGEGLSLVADFSPPPPGTQATLYDPTEPGSVLVFPKFVRGTVAAGVPATEIEISVHCPRGQLTFGFCNLPVPGTNVRMMGHWVCPGQFSTQVCRETDFIFTTTVEGTASFSTEGSNVGVNFTTVRVPAAPCPEGYLIVWAVDSFNRPIKFDGLVGDAVVRWNSHAAGSYKAIAIQADTALANNALIALGPGGALPFDGAPGHYAAVTGTTMAAIKYDTDAGTPAAPDVPSTTSLTLLTLDLLSNRPNYSVFTDLDFFDQNEFVWSTATNYTCWTEIPISSIDPGLVRENMSRKGFFYSADATKVPTFGITDTGGPVTQLGLIDTVECPGNATGTCVPLNAPVTSSNNPSITNHYMYGAYDDSVPVQTLYVP